MTATTTPRLVRELIALGVLLAAVFMTLSLASFAPGDIEALAAPVNVPVRNLGGPFGATLVAVSFRMLGVGTYLALFLIGAWASVALFRGGVPQWRLRLLASLSATGALIAALGATAPPHAAMPVAGGVIGAWLLGVGGAVLGTAGSPLAFGLTSVCALLLATDRFFVPIWREARQALVRRRTEHTEAQGCSFPVEHHQAESQNPVAPAEGALTRLLHRATAKLRAARSQTRTELGIPAVASFEVEDLPFTQDATSEHVASVELMPNGEPGAEPDAGAPGDTAFRAAAAAEPPNVRLTPDELAPIPAAHAEPSARAHAPRRKRPATPTTKGDARRASGQRSRYVLPPLSLLEPAPPVDRAALDSHVRQRARALTDALGVFKIESRVVGVKRGPTVAQYELKLTPGTKLRKLNGLDGDLAMALRAPSVRIVAPLPGRGTIGIEVPNEVAEIVTLREMLNSRAFTPKKLGIPMALGRDAVGAPVIRDLSAMPHLLIAGTTGSGKSVAANVIIMSILYTKHPAQVKFVMIDPKMVEFAPYRDIPHLLLPVVTDNTEAPAVMDLLVAEMERRYSLLEHTVCKHIREYNALSRSERRERHVGKPKRALPAHLPYIVAFVDELADLMMVAGKDVEASICRLAQKSRAVGIHLVLATQRPSVDVLTGLIKANIPSRLSFRVLSGIDSKTILDRPGAEKLLGRGDMLFVPPGASAARRAQCAFVTTEEILRVVAHVKRQAPPDYVTLKVSPKDSASPRPGRKPRAAGNSRAA